MNPKKTTIYSTSGVYNLPIQYPPPHSSFKPGPLKGSPWAYISFPGVRPKPSVRSSARPYAEGLVCLLPLALGLALSGPGFSFDVQGLGFIFKVQGLFLGLRVCRVLGSCFYGLLAFFRQLSGVLTNVGSELDGSGHQVVRI